MRSIVIGAALGTLSLSMAAASPPPEKLEKFEVVLTGMVAISPPQPSALNERRAIREKDVVASAPLAIEDVAKAAQDIKVRVAGYDWTVKSGETLRRTISATGGDLGSLPSGAPVYCGEEFDKKGAEAQLLTLGLAGLVSQLETRLRVCLADRDSDGRFDKGFLVGTKRPADRVLVDVASTAYAARRLEAVPGSRLDVIYYDGTALKGPSFRINLYVEGEQYPFTGLGLYPVAGAPTPAPGAATPTRWSGGLGEWIKPKKLPQTFEFGDMVVTVHAIDAATRVATVSVDRDASRFRVWPWQANVRFVSY